ncbi:EcsC family protein [Endozoicomonadaceae bacterium StTr2]
MPLSDQDLTELQTAKNLLENPGLAAKITNYVGTPIEKGFELLPDNWNKSIGEATQTALMKASEAAVFTMKDIPGEEASTLWHKVGVAITGGVGGFFGVTALAAELPVSTTIMLRSIADIARSEGESVSGTDTKLACLEVFALGGGTDSDDGAESGYFAIRTALANSIVEAAEHIAQKGLTEKGAPAIVKLIMNIAEKFGVQITQKVAAQAIPAIGAAGGAVINTLFIDHFQDMARGHFKVRKLERKYSPELVKEQYDFLPGLG